MSETQPEEMPIKAPEATGEAPEISSEEYWKKPKATKSASGTVQSGVVQVGLWSRSFVFRAFVWIAALLAATLLALVASAYLSDFDSVLEMLKWIKGSLVG